MEINNKHMKNLNIKNKLFYTLILFLSVNNISFAASDGTENIKTLLNNISNNILSTAGTVLMTAAFITFFYGIVMFIIGRVSDSGDLKSIEKGKEFMLWGLVALFVMVSVWGIIRMAQGLLGVEGSNINIQPVSFKYSNVTSDSQDPATGVTGDNNGATKKSKGESCKVLSGALNSQCKSGLSCLGVGGKMLATGSQGTCQ